jgi:predicted metalloprotease
MSTTTDPTRTKTAKSATQIARAAQRKLIPLAIALCVAIGAIAFGATSIVGAHDKPGTTTTTPHHDDHGGSESKTDTRSTDGGASTDGGDEGGPGTQGDDPQVDPAEVDQVVASAVTDIEGYWARTLPAVYGRDFTPLADVVPYDPDADQVTCGGQDNTVADNAFFCPQDNFVAYDRGFLAKLAAEHGVAVTAFAIAHEIGHSIEEQMLDVSQMPTIDNELTADCLAGAWAGDATQRGVLNRDDLDEAVDLMIEVADRAGTPADADDAHGNRRERIDSFNIGLDGGPSACIPQA